MAPTLVVLAAGMGSRYGGLKQIEPVGPSGETLLDYSVFDARRAGFGRVVFVIRRDFEEDFRRRVGSRYAGTISVDYAFQAVDSLPGGFRPPAGREKPWGTGHAVWCAQAQIQENFAVVNADDFYGTDSFAQLAKFFGGLTSSYALVGFRLGRTLSDKGPVARGICGIEGNQLVSLVEQTEITPAEVGPGKKFTGNEMVSMNCWGFTPAIFSGLEARFAEFLAAQGGSDRAEFYLPEAVGALVDAGKARVEVLKTASSWFGVTYREDKPRVTAAIAELIRRRQYPEKLF